MARYKDGLKVADCLFEAALWHYAVHVTCFCRHTGAFDPHGLFWRFHKKGWNDGLGYVPDRMWCRKCREFKGQKVRPRKVTLVQPYPPGLITLTLPDEREWKRLTNRYRG